LAGALRSGTLRLRCGTGLSDKRRAAPGPGKSPFHGPRGQELGGGRLNPPLPVQYPYGSKPHLSEPG
jgi:hypothetical protein